jgi:ZIP family zinc transporter
MPHWLEAGFWGLVAGSALLLGAAIGYFVPVRQRVVAGVMAFGSGVLISALSFDLVGEAYEQAGFYPTAVGFLAGAALFSGANWMLAHQGARHRKRSGHQQPRESEDSGSGLALAIGALIDGVPESIAIGVSMIHGGVVSVVAVVAIFLSNIPEGLSSSAGMKNAGRSRRYVFLLWGGIALSSGVAALLGYSLFSQLPAEVTAATIALAAGAILAMLTDTMVPEAFETVHNFAGLITVLGYLVAFLLNRLAE